MDPLIARLRRGDRLVGDGALGTLLASRGLRPGEPPERWTLDRADIVIEIAARYVDAGADLITTNTFGASPLRLATHSLGGHTAQLNRRAVQLARAAVHGRAYISADVGPTGLLLAPVGETDPAEVAQSFGRQVRALAEAGPDVIVIETMTDVQEATLAVEAARREAPQIPVIALMTFDVTPRGAFTVMGTSVPKAVEALERAGADAIGSNCGTGIEDMLVVAREFRACASVPLMMQPNAGLPRRSGGRLEYPDDPARFAAGARRLFDLGVSVVGGCCGTTPEHIAAVRAVLDEG